MPGTVATGAALGLMVRVLIMSLLVAVGPRVLALGGSDLDGGRVAEARPRLRWLLRGRGLFLYMLPLLPRSYSERRPTGLAVGASVGGTTLAAAVLPVTSTMPLISTLLALMCTALAVMMLCLAMTNDESGRPTACRVSWQWPVTLMLTKGSIFM